MRKECFKRKSQYFLGLCFFCLTLDIAASNTEGSVGSRNAASIEVTAVTRPAIKAKQVMRGLYTDIAACGDRLVAVGDRGQIAYSDTQGSSWLQAEVPVSQLLTAVFFIAPYGWSVGHDGVILSTENCGSSWQVQYMVARDLVKLASSPDNLEDQSNQKIAPLLDLFFFNQKEGVVVGGYGLLLRTLDGGRSWQDWSDRIDNPDGLHFNVLTQDHQGRVYLGAETGLLFRTENQGVSWLPLETPMSTSIYGLGYTKNSDQSTLLMVGLGGEAYASADHALTWKKIQIQTSTHLNAVIEWGDRGLLIAGHSGLLFLLPKNSEKLEPIDIGGKTAVVGLVQTKDDALVVVGQGGIRKIPRHIK